MDNRNNNGIFINNAARKQETANTNYSIELFNRKPYGMVGEEFDKRLKQGFSPNYVKKVLNKIRKKNA